MNITVKKQKYNNDDIIVTDKYLDILRAFGLTPNRIKEREIQSCEFKISEGGICIISGVSGSGKSLLLDAIKKAITEQDKTVLDINEIDVTAWNSAVCDNINHGFLDTLRTLSMAGLTDVFCVLNSPANLSDGQKYRYKLAKAISGNYNVVIADNFLDSLDRVTASVIAHNLRKFATKTGKIFIFATCHDDLFAELEPDVIILTHLNGNPNDVVYKELCGNLK